MLGHVGGQDGVDHHLAAPLVVFFRKIFENVILFISHQGEGRGDMVVLQDALIVVANSDLILGFNEERIVDSWVLVVMTTPANQQRSQVQSVQVAFILEVAFKSKVVDCLAHIRSVRLIVVHYVHVATLDLPDKFQKDFNIY